MTCSSFCSSAGLHVLELGSGVGLAGIVASRIARHTVVSDYMPAVTANLKVGGGLYFYAQPQPEAPRCAPQHSRAA